MNIDTGEILDLEDVKKKSEEEQKKFKPIPPEFMDDMEFMNRKERRKFYKANRKRFKEYEKECLAIYQKYKSEG
ncbi:MAG: hypothetical protein ACE5H1_00790 [Thermodesulfobacteriota bacterium]